MARLDGNDLDAIRAKPARLKGNAAPVVDLDDLDAVRAEIARLRGQRCRINRQLRLLDHRRCRLEPRRRSARRDAVDSMLAEYAAYHAASAPVVAATPVPKDAGRTVGEAAPGRRSLDGPRQGPEGRLRHLGHRHARSLGSM